MRAHFRRQWIIQERNAPPIATAASPAIEAPPSDPDMSSRPVPAKKLKPRVIKPPTPLISAALSNDLPLVVIDISSPVVAKKSNPRVIKPTPAIPATVSSSKESPLVVIDISNDPETVSDDETILTIAETHQHLETTPKSKINKPQTAPDTTREPSVDSPLINTNDRSNEPLKIPTPTGIELQTQNSVATAAPQIDSPPSDRGIGSATKPVITAAPLMKPDVISQSETETVEPTFESPQTDSATGNDSEMFSFSKVADIHHPRETVPPPLKATESSLITTGVGNDKAAASRL